MDSITAAAIQMSAGQDKMANLETADRLVRQAVDGGASLVVLPELFSFLGRHEAIAGNAEPVPGPTTETMAELARGCRVTLLAGSIAERTGDGRVFNTSVIFTPEGDVAGRYRKIHLFDVTLEDGPQVTESRWISPGEEVSVVDTAAGRVGQTICYDLRFPELYRRLAEAKADVLVVPSAFTARTGRAHWEPLLRARAIENQAFVIAPDQFGEQVPGLPLHGHSLIVDPWGEILAEASGDEEDVVIAQLDAGRLETVRRGLPALRHRRL